MKHGEVDKQPNRIGVAGFTLLELMAVLAVIAILMLLAIPSMQDSRARKQVVEVVEWASFATDQISGNWRAVPVLPADNVAAGLPGPNLMIGNYVKSVTVEDGALQIVLGNRAMSVLNGKTLTLRPATVAAAPAVTISWLCGHVAAPSGMNAAGTDRTNIDKPYLPFNCQ